MRAGSEPVTILELGAGSGQFAFHFVRALTELCRHGRAAAPFRYVLSDFAPGTRDAWGTHPSLQPLLVGGTVDTAAFVVCINYVSMFLFGLLPK